MKLFWEFQRKQWSDSPSFEWTEELELLQRLRGICFYGEDDEDDDFGSPDDDDDYGDPEDDDDSQDISADIDAAGGDPSPGGPEGSGSTEEEEFSFDPVGALNEVGIDEFDRSGSVFDIDDPYDFFDFGPIESAINELEVEDIIGGVFKGALSLALGPAMGILAGAAVDFFTGKSFGQTVSNAAVDAVAPGASSLGSLTGLDDIISGLFDDVIAGTPTSITDAYDNLQDFVQNAVANQDVGGLGGIGDVDQGEFDLNPGVFSKNRIEFLLDALNQIKTATPNPGIPTQQLDDIIRAGVLGTNFGQPGLISSEDATLQNFFGNPDAAAIGQSFLDRASRNLGEGFARQNDPFFAGLRDDSISPDETIDRIIAELLEPASREVALFEGRGNLNRLGGLTANKFLGNQEASTREFLGERATNLQDRFSAGLQDIETRADEAARGFRLGQPDFDFTPFEQEATTLAGQFGSDLEPFLREGIGDRQFFDPRGAISRGAQSQGLVSGGFNSPSTAPGPAGSGVVDALTGSRSTFRDTRRNRGNVGRGAF